MKRKKTATRKQRRLISMSFSAPVWADLEVERSGDDWIIVGIRRHGCDLSARQAMECMGAEDLEELDRRANEAEDID